MIDFELARAALCFAVAFAVCEVLAVIFGAALAWLLVEMR